MGFRRTWNRDNSFHEKTWLTVIIREWVAFEFWRCIFITPAIKKMCLNKFWEKIFVLLSFLEEWQFPPVSATQCFAQTNAVKFCFLMAQLHERFWRFCRMTICSGGFENRVTVPKVRATPEKFYSPSSSTTFSAWILWLRSVNRIVALYLRIDQLFLLILTDHDLNPRRPSLGARSSSRRRRTRWRPTPRPDRKGPRQRDASWIKTRTE